MKKLLAAVFAVVLICTGCANDSESGSSTADTETTAETSEMTAGTVKPLEEGDAYAVDKLEFTYMPEGWQYFGKFENQMAIVSPGNCQVDINAANYLESFTPNLEEFANSCMASLRINNMLYQTDLLYDEPYHITVGKPAYDGVVYEYTLVHNTFETGTDGSAVTDAEGSEIKTEVLRERCKAVFFYSGADVYYMIFSCPADRYDELVPEFDALIADLDVHEDFKAADTSALIIPTQETTVAE
jgi:hypothetical protein